MRKIARIRDIALRVRKIHSNTDPPVPGAVSDFLSVTTFPIVDLFSEDLGDRVGGGRLCDILDGVIDVYSLSSSMLGFGSINRRSRREDRYCEDL